MRPRNTCQHHLFDVSRRVRARRFLYAPIRFFAGQIATPADVVTAEMMEAKTNM
jgi:hypothetical protein